MNNPKQEFTGKLFLQNILSTVEPEVSSDEQFMKLINSFLSLLILPKQIALDKKAELYYEFKKKKLSEIMKRQMFR